MSRMKFWTKMLHLWIATECLYSSSPKTISLGSEQVCVRQYSTNLKTIIINFIIQPKYFGKSKLFLVLSKSISTLVCNLLSYMFYNITLYTYKKQKRENFVTLWCQAGMIQGLNLTLLHDSENFYTKSMTIWNIYGNLHTFRVVVNGGHKHEIAGFHLPFRWHSYR